MAEGKCDTDIVVERMENIMTLKNLKKQIEAGKTTLPIPVEAVDAEIERQRQAMEDSIAECGSLENVPEEALREMELEPENVTLDLSQSGMREIPMDMGEALPGEEI